MRSFRDFSGKLWLLQLDVHGLYRVRDLTGVNLLGALDGPEVLERIASDVVLLVDVLFAALMPRSEQTGEEEFGRRMVGETTEAAFAALFEEFVGFFPTRDDFDNPDNNEELPDDGLTPSLRAESFLWEMAGIVGLHPGPFTLRELVLLARGRQRESWNRFAPLIAATANIMRTGEQVDPNTINPFVRRATQTAVRVGSGAARSSFRKQTRQKRKPKIESQIDAIQHDTP